jgi:hypothetical protein
MEGAKPKVPTQVMGRAKDQLSDSNFWDECLWCSFTNGIYQMEKKASVTGTPWTFRAPSVTASGSSSALTEPTEGTTGYL